jgi:PAS domain S-box-containing protein
MTIDFNEANWQEIFENANDGMIAINRKREIILYNKKAEQILERPKSLTLNHLIEQVLPNTRLIEVMVNGITELNQRMRMGKKSVVVNRRPVRNGNQIIGAIGIFQDISEFEFLSNQLFSVRALNEELDAIIEAVEDGIVVANAQCFIVRANNAYQRMTGITAKEFVGKHVRELLSQGYMNISVTERVIERKSRVDVIDIRNGKDLLFTGMPVFDESGNVRYVVTSVRDVSGLKELEEQLANSEQVKNAYFHELELLRSLEPFKKIITRNSEMKTNIEMARFVAKVDTTVLILGESGVGKELIAQLIHRASKRSKGPFIKINCGAIPSNLLESEFFGYDPGAFTGALKQGKPGLFELANEGTLFLDEVGELPLDLQVKVLRAIQDKEIIRIGAQKSIKLNIRIVAATNRNLEKMVEEKNFREDLYYRLKVVPITLPPLRERKEDILPLVMEFLNLFNQRYQIQKWIHPQLMETLLEYDWPGNVRELENTIERLVVTCQDDCIGSNNSNEISFLFRNKTIKSPITLNEHLAGEEKRMISEAYELTHNTRRAALLLGISQSSFVKKMKKYRLNEG